MRLAPRLIDVCPAYGRALDAFEAAVLDGDVEGSEEAWKLVVNVAREYRRLRLVVPA